MEQEAVKQAGYWFAQGFLNWVALMFVVGMAIIFAVNLGRRVLGIGVDDTDLSTWKRSDLKIYTDHKTGVQYVGNKTGLTVRVDKDGHPLVVEH